MRLQNKKYFIIIIFLSIFVVCGFALLSSSLNINGTTTIQGNTWNVHFQNIVVDSNNTVTGTEAIVNDTTINYSVTLNKPGDVYAFTVDVVNTGSIDAMINTINKSSLTTDEEKLISYNVVYSDGIDILQYDKLSNTNGLDTILFLVQYKNDIINSDLPSTPLNLNLSFSIDYVQSDNNAILRNDRYYYRFNHSRVLIGDNFNSNNFYLTEEDMRNNYSFMFWDYYQRYYVKNNIIFTGYLYVKLNGKNYYFKYDSNSYYVNSYLASKCFGSCTNDESLRKIYCLKYSDEFDFTSTKFYYGDDICYCTYTSSGGACFSSIIPFNDD